jgi:hypothetical protein
LAVAPAGRSAASYTTIRDMTVVTSLGRGEAKARHLYETIYCARGEMENFIKECQLDLSPTAPRPLPCAPISSA